MNTEQRLYGLGQELGEVESQMVQLEQERRRLRTELSLLVEELGGKVRLAGVGRLEVSNARVVVSYDRKQVEAVILKLIDLGQYHIADALRACKESARPGTLRILREIPR